MKEAISTYLKSWEFGQDRYCGSESCQLFPDAAIWIEQDGLQTGSGGAVEVVRRIVTDVENLLRITFYRLHEYIKKVRRRLSPADFRTNHAHAQRRQFRKTVGYDVQAPIKVRGQSERQIRLRQPG